MRKLVSILLLFVLLLNLFGFYLSFVLKQGDIRNEMTAFSKTKSTHLQILSFSKHDFAHIVWTTTGKEFRFNGQLYDVSKIEFTTNYVKLFVDDDTIETSLVADFVSVVQEKSSKDETNAPVKFLLQHFLSEFTVESNVALLHPPVNSFSVFEKAIFPFSFVSDLHSPPPQLG